MNSDPHARGRNKTPYPNPKSGRQKIESKPIPHRSFTPNRFVPNRRCNTSFQCFRTWDIFRLFSWIVDARQSRSNLKKGDRPRQEPGWLHPVRKDSITSWLLETIEADFQNLIFHLLSRRDNLNRLTHGMIDKCLSHRGMHRDLSVLEIRLILTDKCILFF